MELIEHLFIVAKRFAGARDISETTLAIKVFNDGKKFQNLREGKDIGVRKIHEAMQWLSNEWPEGLIWPEGIARPEPDPSRTPVSTFADLYSSVQEAAPAEQQEA